MISGFIVAHRTLAYLAMASLLGLSGYGFARLSPKHPGNAIGSWAMALFYFCFGLASIRDLDPLSPILAVAAAVGGIAWMARYYERHRRE